MKQNKPRSIPFEKATLKRFGVRLHDDKLIIPLCDRTGKVIRSVRRDIRATPNNITVTHNLNTLYNWDSITVRGRDYLIVTTGVFNVWWLWQIGFSYVVGMLNANLGEPILSYFDSMMIKTATIWVITDDMPTAIAQGSAIAANLSKIRFVRHIITKQIIGSSHDDIQKLFNNRA